MNRTTKKLQISNPVPSIPNPSVSQQFLSSGCSHRIKKFTWSILLLWLSSMTLVTDSVSLTLIDTAQAQDHGDVLAALNCGDANIGIYPSAVHSDVSTFFLGTGASTEAAAQPPTTPCPGGGSPALPPDADGNTLDDGATFPEMIINDYRQHRGNSNLTHNWGLLGDPTFRFYLK